MKFSEELKVFKIEWQGRQREERSSLHNRKTKQNVGYAKQMLEKLMTQRNILPQITDSVASPSSRSFPCEY